MEEIFPYILTELDDIPLKVVPNLWMTNGITFIDLISIFLTSEIGHIFICLSVIWD